MLNLQQIESDLTSAMKAKAQLVVDVLRGLKTRMQNEKISKMADLSESDTIALVRSEVKKRKEAAETYQQGGRQELADKELSEVLILEKYLPAQMPATQLSALIEKTIAENNFSAKDFGAAMGVLKSKLAQLADGAVIAKLLKEKLK